MDTCFPQEGIQLLTPTNFCETVEIKNILNTFSTEPWSLLDQGLLAVQFQPVV